MKSNYIDLSESKEFIDGFNALVSVFKEATSLKQQRMLGGFEGLIHAEPRKKIRNAYRAILDALSTIATPVKPIVAQRIKQLDYLIELFPYLPEDQREFITESLTHLKDHGQGETARQFGAELLALLTDEPTEKPASQLLDLSESNADDLSRKLSDIMKNPLLPEGIYHCIHDQLANSADQMPDSPESIKSALLNQQKDGAR